MTETDLAISKLIISEVKKNFPAHVVFDEELQHVGHDSEFIWVCDPVDGTIPFAHHIPTSMFSLALCHNGEPVVAVTYDPFMKRLLYTKSDSPSFTKMKKKLKSNKGNLFPVIISLVSPIGILTSIIINILI